MLQVSATPRPHVVLGLPGTPNAGSGACEACREAYRWRRRPGEPLRVRVCPRCEEQDGWWTWYTKDWWFGRRRDG